MKLSTKATYGVRAVLAIALKEGAGALSVKEIARQERISVTYLEQLLNRLKRAGIVRSIRGPKGGYVLARQKKSVTMRELVELLEGAIAPVGCVSSGARGDGGSTIRCGRSGRCAVQGAWQRLARAVSRCLEGITIADLCRSARRKGMAS